MQTEWKQDRPWWLPNDADWLANSVDLDQTAPCTWAVPWRYTLFMPRPLSKNLGTLWYIHRFGCFTKLYVLFIMHAMQKICNKIMHSCADAQITDADIDMTFVSPHWKGVHSNCNLIMRWFFFGRLCEIMCKIVFWAWNVIPPRETFHENCYGTEVNYLKNPKNLDTQKICCNHAKRCRRKCQQCWPWSDCLEQSDQGLHCLPRPVCRKT